LHRSKAYRGCGKREDIFFDLDKVFCSARDWHRDERQDHPGFDETLRHGIHKIVSLKARGLLAQTRLLIVNRLPRSRMRRRLAVLTAPF
jgi:hypothetical protein